MPHAALRISAGVDEIRTPALNETAISQCNLIRFMPDRQGFINPQKLGGWTKFYSTAMSTVTRALWAWEDTNAVQYLAVGNQANASTLQAQLGVISNGNLRDITPRTVTTNPSVNFSTTSGSSTVVVVDAGLTTSSYDSVFLSTPVSVGGLVLSGFYAVTVISSTSYSIQATDVLGNPAYATSTVTSGGAVPQFTTTSGSSLVTVTLNNHGYSVGSTFAVLIPVVFNGVSLLENYLVQSVIDANNFTIQASTTASSSGSSYINNNKANLVYWIGFGAVPVGTGYGIGGYGRGGYGTGTAIVPTTGTPLFTNDWTMDNFGQILVACPVPELQISFATTSASGTGTTATVGFSNSYTVPVGNSITITGMTPTGYNGTYTVTASSVGSVSYACTATGAQTSAGTITTIDPASGPIFQWDPTSGNPIATVMTYGPPVNDGVFVAMPQRQIVAWGSSFTGVPDPLLLRWCDIQNYNSWIAQSGNQAGSFRIPKGSRIVGCIQGPQQALVWTDLALWSMSYIGYPLVYGFNEVATGCGMIARKAAASFNNVVYWMGQTQFFALGANGVEPIPCPVWDIIFQDLDTSNLNKIRVAVNSRFNEIAWYYPTLSSNGEVAAYVKYNTVIHQWDYGALGRSAWINESVLGPPIGADPASQYIYQHETSPDADGQAMNSYFQTGYFTIGDGDIKTFVDEFWPDAKWGTYAGTQSATLQLYFYVTDFPDQAPTQYGPFTLTQATTYFSPRFRGRLVAIYIGSQDVGSFWRIGAMRYRYMPDGKY